MIKECVLLDVTRENKGNQLELLGQLWDGGHQSLGERQVSRPLPRSPEGPALPVLEEPSKVSLTRELCAVGVY